MLYDIDIVYAMFTCLGRLNVELSLVNQTFPVSVYSFFFFPVLKKIQGRHGLRGYVNCVTVNLHADSILL